jgi:alcohol dehydrogenase (cytochrome c)
MKNIREEVMNAFSNRMTPTYASALASLATALLVSTSPLPAADTTYERLVNPEPHNWLMHHHDYNAQRYSALDAINRGNVGNMRLLFAVALGGVSKDDSLEATPLVEDGFMYMADSSGIVSKIDVRSGACATGSPHSIR